MSLDDAELEFAGGALGFAGGATGLGDVSEVVDVPGIDCALDSGDA